MSKRTCPLDGRETNCTENCNQCLEEERKERETSKEKTK